MSSQYSDLGQAAGIIFVIAVALISVAICVEFFFRKSVTQRTRDVVAFILLPGLLCAFTASYLVLLKVSYEDYDMRQQSIRSAQVDE